jgi:ATP-dependent DNA helicase DinG
LVPALLSGERVLVSTATKTLQDQLYSRDLPHIANALGLPVKMALLKGRANYLCSHRLELARTEALLPDRQSVRALAKVELWSQSTKTGDLAELPGLDERSALVPFITSSRDNCLGSECPHYKGCFLMAARKEAMAADITVINHHLFFADLSVRESGVAELLPSVSVVIFDEAHQLNETGINFLGHQFGSAQWIDFSRDLLAAGLSLGRGLADWQMLSASLELAAREFRLLFGIERQGKLNWSQHWPDGVESAECERVMELMATAIASVLENLELVVETAPDFERLFERATDLSELLERFQKPVAAGSVRWAEVSSVVRWMEAPLDIAEIFREKCLQAQPQPNAQGPAAGKRSWIFTSATLGHDEQLSWFTEPCGLQDARVMQVESPFDYPRQAVLFVPKEMAAPQDPEHSNQVAKLAIKIARTLGGRTLVLTTTLRALRSIGEQMKIAFEQQTQIQVLVQGEASKRELMDRFRQGEDSTSGCVLVASASFWEGFDVPGDALQAVIIDKLPFPPPNDPLVEARSKKIEASGKSAFNHYFLAEAAVSLKQGAGRLIRRETDKGVLVVCDKRLVTTGYGRRLMSNLPNMAKASSEEALLAGLERLTKVSTKNPS